VIKARFAVLTSVGAALVFTGCTALGGGTNKSAWMKDGALALSRPVPDAAAPALRSDPVLGFMPSRHSEMGQWLRIDRSKSRIELMNGATSVATVSGDGVQSLKPGRYTIALKQKSPVWYAPARYFTDRLLDVPGEGNHDRYRRGALGPYALFLNEQTPIHSGPVWREEIGGVRVEESAMSRIFESLDVGATIEVR
jgi:hypothetical protein